MKKIIPLLMSLFLVFSASACKNSEVESVEMEPGTTQMKAICELAVMDCYYHNVAKFKEENAEGFLWWQKDKHFWIEYSGVVTVGIDASLVSIDVNEEEISVTIPKAKVLTCIVDSASLSKDSFIVEKNSAQITAEDEVAAFAAAQDKLKESASNDTALLASAEQRAQSLLEDYITNIGNAVGKEYTIQWNYLKDEDENNNSSASNDSSQIESELSALETSESNE